MDFRVVTLEIAVAVLGIVLLATGLLLPGGMKKINGPDRRRRLDGAAYIQLYRRRGDKRRIFSGHVQR